MVEHSTPVTVSTPRPVPAPTWSWPDGIRRRTLWSRTAGTAGALRPVPPSTAS